MYVVPTQNLIYKNICWFYIKQLLLKIHFNNILKNVNNVTLKIMVECVFMEWFLIVAG